MGERRTGEPPLGGIGDDALGADLVEHGLIIGGIDDDTDVRVVLRRGADHRRPTDVDQLDSRIRAERIQVDDDEIDRLDAVGVHVGPMIVERGIGEDPAVDLRMERDHSMAEDRRHARQLDHVGDLDPGVGDRRRGTAARNQLPAEFAQAERELDDAGFVEHGEERGGHAPNVVSAPRPRTMSRWQNAPGRWTCGADEWALRSEVVARHRKTLALEVLLDFSKFKVHDWLMIGGGAAMLLLGMLLDWTKIDFGGFSTSGDGPFDYFFTGGIAWILVVAVGVLALLNQLGKLPPTQPWPLIFLGATGVAAILMILRILLGARIRPGRARRRHVRRRAVDRHLTGRCDHELHRIGRRPERPQGHEQAQGELRWRQGGGQVASPSTASSAATPGGLITSPVRNA